MNISMGKRWELFVEEQVKQGRYKSQSEVVREGLRLVEEREAKLADLKATIAASIERGGENSLSDVKAHLRETAERLKREAE